MDQDLIKIKKILLISFVVIIVIFAACFIIFSAPQFYSVLTSGLLTFIFFILTLLLYYRAVKSGAKSMAKHIFFVFFIKLILSALSFFIVFKLGYLDRLTYSFSFLIFFTIFFNVEIFLIYKKFLFNKK